jgi:hypothetical protein
LVWLQGRLRVPFAAISSDIPHPSSDECRRTFRFGGWFVGVIRPRPDISRIAAPSAKTDQRASAQRTDEAGETTSVVAQGAARVHRTSSLRRRGPMVRRLRPPHHTVKAGADEETSIFGCRWRRPHAHGEANAFGRWWRRAHPACNETHAFGHGRRSMRREGGNRTFGIGGDPSNPHRERPKSSDSGWNRGSQRRRRTAPSGTEGNQRDVPAETEVFGQRRKPAQPAWTETNAFGQRRKPMHRLERNQRLRAKAELGATRAKRNRRLRTMGKHGAPET